MKQVPWCGSDHYDPSGGHQGASVCQISIWFSVIPTNCRPYCSPSQHTEMGIKMLGHRRVCAINDRHDHDEEEEEERSTVDRPCTWQGPRTKTDPRRLASSCALPALTQNPKPCSHPKPTTSSNAKRRQNILHNFPDSNEQRSWRWGSRSRFERENYTLEGWSYTYTKYSARFLHRLHLLIVNVRNKLGFAGGQPGECRDIRIGHSLTGPPASVCPPV